MVLSGRATFWCVTAFFFACLLSDTAVLAKEEKEKDEKTWDPTPRPTPAPTFFPSSNPTTSPSALPSTFPSFFPTATPTISPSTTPTISPTETLTEKPTETKSPTETPSEAPTTTPTTSVTKVPTTTPITTPTATLTATPSTKPTTTPTATPPASPGTPSIASTKTTTIAPTIISSAVGDDIVIQSDAGLRQTQSPADTLEEGEKYSLCPVMIFDIILSDECDSIRKIQSSFVHFLDGVLEETSTPYGFDYSHLDYNGILSSFNTHQPLCTRYRLTMEGFVYYFDETPTMESLAQSLNIYFSFWGASDLQDYFMSLGFEKAVVVAISVGGENVSIVSNVLEKESQGGQNSDRGIWNIFYKDGGDLSKPSIVMMYAGLILTAVVIALLVFRYRIGRRRLHLDEESKSRKRHSSKKSNDGDEERGVSLKVQPKTLPREKTGMSASISTRGVNASKKLSKKVLKDIKNHSEPFSEKKLGNSKTGKETCSPRDKASGELEKKIGDSKTGKEKYNLIDNARDDLSINVSEKASQNSKTITDESGSSTTPSTLNMEEKISDVESDMKTCKFANQISSAIRKLDPPCHTSTQEEISNQTYDSALKRELGEF